MFYSQSLLSKKGPLGTIWIAAYFYKKLKKEQIAQTNIPSSIDKIIPEVQISYRVLAHLLLGVVRIFSKKVDYLYDDCNVVLIELGKPFLPRQRNASRDTNSASCHKIPLAKAGHAPKCNAFESHDVIQPIEAICAPYHEATITRPEKFELDSFDLEVPEEDLNAKTHKQLTLEVAGKDEWDHPSLLSERHYEETQAHFDFSSACFTPIEDVFPPHVMDVDPEICELHNSTSLEVRLKNLQGDLPPLQECGNHSSARKTLNLDIPAQEPKQQVELIKTKLSDFDRPHALVEGYSEAITQIKDLIPSPCASGAASPGFTVTTPAIKERHQMSRKRKFLLDENIVLSNQVLRQCIHDASRLICKRRKAPHTSLDVWKAHKIPNLQNSFMEPLIPCFSLDLYSLSLKKSSDSPVLRHTEMTSKSDDKLAKLTEQRNQSQETYSPEALASVSPAEAPTADKLDAGRPEEPVIETSDSEESSSLDGDTSRQGGWSGRTRSVARYLCNAFLNQKEQKQKGGSLSLAKILEGKKRAKCAKFFYGTLTLKGFRCLDVEQESAYGDIIISATPQLESMFKVR